MKGNHKSPLQAPRPPDRREQARQQHPQHEGARDATRENLKNPQKARDDKDPGDLGPTS